MAFSEYELIVISGEGGGPSQPVNWGSIEDKPTVFPPDPALIPDGEYVVPHTWVIPGEVFVPSGDTNVLPPMLVDTVGYDATIVRVSSKTGVGTVTFNTKVDTTDLGLFVSTTNSTTATYNQVVPVGSGITPVVPFVTAVSGTPKNLSITVFIKYKKKEV